jgi:hypothetical protein
MSADIAGNLKPEFAVFATFMSTGFEGQRLHKKQGCQMVHFSNQKSNFGKFCRALEWKVLV